MESLFVAEHKVIPSSYTTIHSGTSDGKFRVPHAPMDPFVVLAITANATPRIKIGTAICLLPQRM